MSAEVAEFLRAAKAKIVEHGWIQGAYGDEERGFCADGALGISEDPSRQQRLARRALRKSVGSDCIARWNDEPTRTVEEVLAAFDRAIEAERSKP